MKKYISILLTIACLSLSAASFTSCAVPGGAVIATTIIGQIEAWAIPIADKWLQDWIHSHLGASKSAAASHEDQFVADNMSKAQKAYPQATSKAIEAGLRSAYQKSLVKK